jgi:hypothetical protein
MKKDGYGKVSDLVWHSSETKGLPRDLWRTDVQQPKTYSSFGKFVWVVVDSDRDEVDVFSDDFTQREIKGILMKQMGCSLSELNEIMESSGMYIRKKRVKMR